MAVSGAAALFSPKWRGENGPTEREGIDPKDGLERSAEYWLREEEEEDDEDIKGGGGGGGDIKLLAVTSITLPFPFPGLLHGIWSRRIPVDNLLLCDVLFCTVLYCFNRFKVAIIIFWAVL